MSIVSLKYPTRILLLSLFIIMLATATAIVGGTQSAQAFECASGGPKPVSCPFLKVQQQDEPYSVLAELYEPSSNGPDTVLSSWKEEREVFTLWHWRWQGDKTRVRGVINTLDEEFPMKKFDFPASETHCYLVNGEGISEAATSDCNDSEDPQK